MALIKCKDCGTEVSTAAQNCPKCGSPVRSAFSFKRVLLGVLVVVALLVAAIIATALLASGSKTGSGSGSDLLLGDIHRKVATDAVTQYELALKSGDRVEICVRAGMAAAAWSQAKDEAQYLQWKQKEKNDCAAAGIQK